MFANTAKSQVKRLIVYGMADLDNQQRLGLLEYTDITDLSG